MFRLFTARGKNIVKQVYWNVSFWCGRHFVKTPLNSLPYKLSAHAGALCWYFYDNCGRFMCLKKTGQYDKYSQYKLMAHSWGWSTGCLLWIQSLINVILMSMQYGKVHLGTPFSKIFTCPTPKILHPSICLYKIKMKNLLKSTCPAGSFTCPRLLLDNGKRWALVYPNKYVHSSHIGVFCCG